MPLGQWLAQRAQRPALKIQLLFSFPPPRELPVQSLLFQFLPLPSLPPRVSPELPGPFFPPAAQYPQPPESVHQASRPRR